MLKKENRTDSPPSSVRYEPGEENKTRSLSDSAGQNEKTIIGENITIEGSIHGEENIIIEGTMKGDIELQKHDFVLGSKGRFEGEVHAQNVSISGQMIGNINTHGKVEIAKEADFIGKIRAKNFLVEEGAYFKGAIELDREPHRKFTPTEKTKPEKAASPAKGSDGKP